MTEQPFLASPPTGHPPQPQPRAHGPRRLTRSRDDRWVAGVCGGIAQYTGVDTTLVRLVVVLGTVLGVGSLVIAYVAAWMLMPMEPPPDAA